jgi:4a-hydroxytetrahydrobiopterin dehydratase
MTRLDDEAVAAAVHDLPGWTRDGDALARTVELPSFPAAIGVVRRVAEVAEMRDHHPDIDIRYRTVTFRCWTHTADGITDADVALARAISEQVDGRTG